MPRHAKTIPGRGGGGLQKHWGGTGREHHTHSQGETERQNEETTAHLTSRQLCCKESRKKGLVKGQRCLGTALAKPWDKVVQAFLLGTCIPGGECSHSNSTAGQEGKPS